MFRGLLSVFYLTLIASYAFFGYFDAISTSYCLETRPGMLLSDDIFEHNFKISLLNGGLIESNVTNLSFTNRLGITQALDYFTETYFIDSIYHNLTCSKGNIDIFYSTTGGMVVRNYTQLRSGFLANTAMVNPNTFKCRFTSYSEDCSLKPRTKRNFLMLALTTTVLAVFLYFISSNFFHFYYIRYIMQKVMLCLGIDIPSTHHSCNPITRVSHYLPKGSKISQLGDQPNVGLDRKKFFTSEGTCILLENNKAYFFIKNNSEIFDIDQHTETEISKMLYLIDNNPSLWPMDADETHYYSVSHLVEKISLGSFVTISNKKASGLVNNDETMANFIKSGLEIKKNACRALIHHNKEFFSKTGGNLIAMQLAVSGKTSWYNKPESVGNKQWKLYSSDLSHFLERLKIGRIFTQGKYDLTASMANTINKFEEGLFDRACKKDDDGTIDSDKAVINLMKYEVVTKAKELMVRHDKLLDNNVRELKRITHQAHNENLVKIVDIIEDSAKLQPADALSDDPFKRLGAGLNNIKSYADALKAEDATFDEERLKELNKQLRAKQKLSILLDKVDRIRGEGKQTHTIAEYKLMHDAKSKCGAKYDKLPIDDFLTALDDAIEEHEEVTKAIDDEYFVMVTRKKKNKSLSDNLGCSKPLSLKELKTHVQKIKESIGLIIENKFEFQNRFEVLKMKSDEDICNILDADIMKCMTKWHPQHGSLHIKSDNDFQIAESKKYFPKDSGKKMTRKKKKGGKGGSNNNKKIKSKILLKKFTMDMDNSDIKEVLDNIKILNEAQSSNAGSDILQTMVTGGLISKLNFRKSSSKKLFHKVLNYKINNGSNCDSFRYLQFVEMHVNSFKQTSRYEELYIKKAEMLRVLSEALEI